MQRVFAQTGRVPMRPDRCAFKDPPLERIPPPEYDTGAVDNRPRRPKFDAGVAGRREIGRIVRSGHSFPC